MAVISPRSGGDNDHNRPIDVGVDVEDLSSYHRVKDDDGVGNGMVTSSSVVGRERLRRRQRGTTLLTTTTALTSNPNMTSPLAERFYRALDDVTVIAVTSSSSYRLSQGREEKDKPITGSTGGGGGDDGDGEDNVGGDNERGGGVEGYLSTSRTGRSRWWGRHPIVVVDDDNDGGGNKARDEEEEEKDDDDRNHHRRYALIVDSSSMAESADGDESPKSGGKRGLCWSRQ